MKIVFGVAIGLFLGLAHLHAQQSRETAGTPAPAVAPPPTVYPLDIAVGSDGTAYVADRQLHGVWRWNEGKLAPLFEGSSKYRTPLNAAYSVALDFDGTVLVADSATRDIYRIGSDGKPVAITGGKIGIPVDIAVKRDGTIYVADLELRKLMRIPAGTQDVEHVADVNPRGVFVDGQDQVWVVSQNKEQLLIVSDSGEKQVIVDHRVFGFPHQVVVNSAGEAFVSDGYKKAIWKVVRGSEPTIWFEGPPLDNPVGIALFNDLPVVVDPRARKAIQFDPDGKPQVWFEISR